MRYRKVGVSGLRVSEIGLGSWLTYGGTVEDNAAVACIHRAFELGVNFFDTANVYRRGEAEEVVGRALKGIDRDDYVLATKVYFPMGDGPNDRGLSRKHIMEQCERSLQRLGVDYVDLYQCHRPDPETPLEETLRALDDLVTPGQGALRGRVEVDGGAARRGAPAPAELGLDPLVSNQPQYSMLHREIEEEVIPVSKQLGIGQIVWSPIAQGVLAGKYRPGDQPLPGRERRRRARRAASWSGSCRTTCSRPCSVCGPSPTSWDHHGAAGDRLGAARAGTCRARSWARSRPEQVDENVAASRRGALATDVLKRIDEVLAPVLR